MMISNIKLQLSNGKNPKTQALIDGIHGIAGQSHISEDAKQLANNLYNRLSEQLGIFPEQALDFDQKLDILWASGALGLESNNNLAKDLYTDINLMNFGAISNDLTYPQF